MIPVNFLSENMSSPVINKYCVRIGILDEHDRVINQGSGIIIKKSNEYFVLSARHCLLNNNASLAGIKQIQVERQQNYKDSFEKIVIESIVAVSVEQDWAILKIAELAFAKTMADTNLGENLREGDLVFFRGYQGVNNKQPRTFDGQIIDTADNEFKITLRASTFNQGGELGADIARGLSGSGVLLLRNDKIYLIGHLKSVVGQIALHNDIKCTPVGDWKNLVSPFSFDLKSSENLPWNEDRRMLNDILVRRMFDSMREYDKAIADIGESIDNKPGLWAQQQFRGRVQDVVVNKYFGILGIQITKLIRIGNSDKNMPSNQKEYLNRINITAKRTVQLLTFVFLSKLWDYQGKLSPDSGIKKLLSAFFDNIIEPSITDYFKIITALLNSYISNPKVEWPVEELQDLHGRFQPGTSLSQAFKDLEDITMKTDNNSFTLTDCFDAELHLANILENLAFLSRYKMISVNSAVYRQVRNKNGNYQLSYLELSHSDKKRSKNDEKINYLLNPSSTEAIIFYLNSYDNGVNLSPFVIDYTSLNPDEECQIYFYNSRNLEKKEKLIYSTTAIEGDSNIELEFKNLPTAAPDIIDVLMDPQDRLQLRKDTVYRLFMEATKEILELWGEQDETTKKHS